jgi:hypothetical protein
MHRLHRSTPASQQSSKTLPAADAPETPVKPSSQQRIEVSTKNVHLAFKRAR